MNLPDSFFVSYEIYKVAELTDEQGHYNDDLQRMEAYNAA